MLANTVKNYIVIRGTLAEILYVSQMITLLDSYMGECPTVRF